jgi:hypothetical protein
MMGEIVAEPLNAGPDREQHRPDGVMELHRQAATLLVHCDLGSVAGALGDDRGVGGPSRRRLERRDGEVAVPCLRTVGRVQDPEPAPGVDQRDRRHALHTFAVRLRAERPREIGRIRVVGHPLRPPRLHHMAPESDAWRHHQTLDDIGLGPNRVAQHDAAGGIELADPGDVDADLVGQAVEDRPEGRAPIEQAQDPRIVLVQLQQQVGGPPGRISTASGHQRHGMPGLRTPTWPCCAMASGGATANWRSPAGDPPEGGLHQQLP